jgi:hypothetical protein
MSDWKSDEIIPIAPLNIGAGGAQPVAGGLMVPPTAHLAYGGSADQTITGSDDLAGFSVDASDGHVGKVDKATHTLHDGYLVVDMGHWIFGRRAVVSANVVNNVDYAAGVVYLNASKEQLKGGPELDVSNGLDADGRAQLDAYYGQSAAA